MQAQILNLIKDLKLRHGMAVVLITHDLTIVRKFADYVYVMQVISHDLKVVRALCHRVMVMHEGKVVEEGPVAEVLTNPQTEYTRRLVRAAFDIAA